MSKIRNVKLKKIELSGVLVCYCLADPAKMQETTPQHPFLLLSSSAT